MVVSTSGLLDDSGWMCIELCTYPLSLGFPAKAEYVAEKIQVFNTKVFNTQSV